jgi:hypothetical protein
MYNRWKYQILADQGFVIWAFSIWYLQIEKESQSQGETD